MTRVWMDRGGTFTDVLRVHPDGTTTIDKVWSDTADLNALGASDPCPRRGTTVATNALLERKCAPVLLLTNRGFGDLPWLGDQTRPRLFDRRAQRQPPICTGVVEVGGRIAADGDVLEPVSVDTTKLEEWYKQGLRAVAIVLIHGPRHPASEQQLAAICQSVGFEHVRMGHQVAPSPGFLARMETTLADAALCPLLPTAPGRYMRSDGGTADQPDWRGCDAVLSGPAGGVIATAQLAASAGVGPAFGVDMGGTSTDVCRVDGPPERTDHLRIGGMNLRVPAVRLETVAAGGGSILRVGGGVMGVGPHSAGADPGPAAYGRGGPATVTDAAAVLGWLPVFPSICGSSRDQPLDLQAARDAITALMPDLALEQAAHGFLRVAAEAAARAVRSLAAARGVDPADHALIAFGGAGPAHGCAVARALGIQRVVVPHLAGLFSAVGVGIAPRRAERVVPVRGSIAEARNAAVSALPFSGQLECRLAARHTNTSAIIEVDLSEHCPATAALDATLLSAFAEAHRAEFGFDRPGHSVEAVEVRIRVETDASSAPLAPAQTASVTTVRAWFDGWRLVPCLPLQHADGVSGPALLHGGGTTVVVPQGWTLQACEDHILLIDDHPSDGSETTAFHPVHTAVFSERVMGIAEQMGERLARLARSVSIHERRDFSCAVFDKDGRLIANAPHVPVHLGAMGETVRDLISRHDQDLAPGTAWASNDPYAGGSHLPDITVTRPVFHSGRRIAFVASRGHHIDVGGITPGSMPPDAVHLDEEGLCLRQVCIGRDASFLAPSLPGCRQPEDVLADLEAQVAAAAHGSQAIASLIREMGTEGFEAQLGHLRDHAARSVRAVLPRFVGQHTAREVLDDGTPIDVILDISEDHATVRLSGPAHPRNLNAPVAVSRAALLYVFRTLVDDDLPLLNEGTLEPFTLEIEPGSLFDPQHPAAVAGGNVETSQRLVDALLRALGVQAASQGTMNNLTLGFPEGSAYETIAGGGGAGPGFAGGDAVQVHMTNTRATDVEDFEMRFPARIVRWQRRQHSGGDGQWAGGDGVEKEWLFLADTEVSILAQRRTAGAPGALGGTLGLPGRDERGRNGKWGPAAARWIASAGEGLRIMTPGGGGFGEP